MTTQLIAILMQSLTGAAEGLFALIRVECRGWKLGRE